MITVLIADNEAKVKEILNQMLNNQGNFNLDISKQENIFKIIKKDNFVDTKTTLEDKIVELENTLYAEKRGVLYKSIIDIVEKPLIEHILERTQGNQLKAARILGINRNTMRTKIKKLGIDVNRWRIKA